MGRDLAPRLPLTRDARDTPCSQPPSIKMNPPQKSQHPSLVRFTLPWGDTIEVSLDVFTNEFMPPLPSGLNFDAFIHRLRTRRRHGKQLITREDRLWGYGRTTPAKLPATRAFSHLKTCADRLAAALPHQPRRFRFADIGQFPNNPHTFDSLPHVYFEPCDVQESQASEWCSVAVSGMYTLQTTDVAMTEVSRLNAASSFCISRGLRRSAARSNGAWPTA